MRNFETILFEWFLENFPTKGLEFVENCLSPSETVQDKYVTRAVKYRILKQSYLSDFSRTFL